jgi:hypothetical protein
VTEAGNIVLSAFRVGRWDWDLWRAFYDDMDFEDQAAIGNLIAEAFPTQAHFDTFAARHCFRLIPDKEPWVVEVGGWTGELAAMMLRVEPRIAAWTNFDLCQRALDESVVDDSRYYPVMLDTWPWDLELADRGDVFVATHMIEHIRGWQLEKLAESIQAPYAYIEAPIFDHAKDWAGYEGTHILELGWPGVDAIFRRCGYKILHERPGIRLYAG